MIADIDIVAFLTCDGVVYVGEIPTLDCPQVVYHTPVPPVVRATATVTAITHVICYAAGKFYGARPAGVIWRNGDICNYLVAVDDCLNGSVSLPHSRVEGITPMFDTVEQAITYCDLVTQET